MTNTKILGTAFVFLGIFIIILFTKGQIQNFTLLRAENENLSKLNKEKIQEEKNLKSIDALIEAGANINEIIAENPTFTKEKLEKMKNDIPKYAKKIKEDEILNYIHTLISRTNQTKIESLSISPGVVGQMQFLESDINLSVEVPNEAVLRNLLTKLYNSDEYKFFIPSLDYQEVEKSSGDNLQNSIKIQIPLKVYYK